MEWLKKALETIRNGICDKLTKDKVTVYRVKKLFVLILRRTK
jgi:hypothetical protein